MSLTNLKIDDDYEYDYCQKVFVRIYVNDDETVSLEISYETGSPTASQYDNWFYGQYELRDSNPWDYQRKQEEYYGNYDYCYSDSD